KMLGEDARVMRRQDFHVRLHGNTTSEEDHDLAALRFECAVAERFDGHLNQLLKIRKAKEGEVKIDDMVYHLRYGVPRPTTKPTEGGDPTLKAIAALEKKGKGKAADPPPAIDPLDLANEIMARATNRKSPMMRLLRDQSREKYVNLPPPPVPGSSANPREDQAMYVFSYEVLLHYLVTHAAIVNRGVRRVLSRGPYDTYVRKLPG
ncbi:MAG: hypothetical protein ABSE49_34110, partial [Polyangiaceae bacterium]